MTTYTVHIYREMRLSYAGIEADTPQAAAIIASGKLTDEADNIDDCDGEDLSALVDAAGDADYRHSVTIDFAGERARKAARALLDACRLVIARWEQGDLAEAARACQAAVALATDGRPPWDITEAAPAGGKPFSVLMLYPDHANDSGTETYYAYVQATDAIAAVAEAQQLAVAAQEGIDIEPDEFAPLLVTQGHHASLPLFNK